jgi:fructose/tagatose bisphosphate aldolase
MNQDIDKLVYQAVFGKDEEKSSSKKKIYQLAIENNIILSSINDLYMSRGREELPHSFTVPAMNIRGMTYDTARAAFKAANTLNVQALIFELARSEMSYTDQPPLEYATVIMAAALKEGWSGPLFIQGDHFQAKPETAGTPKSGEIEAIKKLIKESINAGFYNIDIDMSTLVDLDKKTETEQQASNISYSVELTKYIRQIEPKGITVSIGGEIGHIGGVNSSNEDFIAYIDGYNKLLGEGKVGMSKVSVNTGSSHGGVVLADGSLADVDIDFSILKNISQLGRDKYKLGGAVQHGASTLPDEHFSQFVVSEAIEVHLATGFQNLLLDHPDFPKKLLRKMYKWLDENQQDEKKEDMTQEQFHYKLRKKAFGQFKKEIWDIPEEIKSSLRDSLEKRFEFFYKELGVINSKSIIDQTIKPVTVPLSEIDFGDNQDEQANVEGLDD